MGKEESPGSEFQHRGSIGIHAPRESGLLSADVGSPIQIYTRIPTNIRFSFFQSFNKSIYHLVNDLPSLTYATHSVLTDFQNDGVTYLELRTIPRASPSSIFTREEYLTTVLDTISHFQSTQSPSQKMTVNLILALDRGHSTPISALEIVDLAIAHRARGIVGIDVCGNPTKGDVSILRAAFAKAKANGLGVTVHFAEMEEVATPGELETLLDFEPDRLGHVIHVPEELKGEIARRRLGLELCMSCNVHAKMFDGGFLDHHFGYWRFQDCPVVLCVSVVSSSCSYPSNPFGEAVRSTLRLLMVCRPMTWVSFAAPCQTNICWLQSTSSSAGLMS